MLPEEELGKPKVGENNHHRSLAEELESVSSSDVDIEKVLFSTDTIEDLITKGDITESAGLLIVRLLAVADELNLKYRKRVVKYYLMTRIGKDRQGRKELVDFYAGKRRADMDRDLELPPKGSSW